MTSSTLGQHGRTLKLEGFLVIILGITAILLPSLFALGLELLLAALFVIGGVASVARGIRLRGFSGSGLTIVMGVFSVIVGISLLAFPLSGVITLTLLVGALFLLQGVGELIVAMQHRQWKSWGWMVASGIASVLIGLFLILGLPGTAVWAVGLLVGINLLFSGFWLVHLGSTVSKIPPETNHAGL